MALGVERVSIFSDAYDDYTVCLVNALSSHCRVLLVQPDHEKRFDPAELNPQVELERVDKPRIRDPRGVRAGQGIRKRLLAFSPDVIHLQQSGDPTLNPWFVNLNKRRPVVLTVHDVRPHPGDGNYRRGAYFTQRVLARSVNDFVVHGQGLRRELTEDWAASSEHTHVIPHGELGRLYRDRTPATVAFRREENRVLFFGRRWGYKGFDVLKAALSSGALSDRGLTLVVAGSGEPIGDLEAQLPPNIALHVIDRYLPAEEVVEQFDRASLVCLPYIEASQSGVAALALGLGTPIVASDIGGLSEMLGGDVASMVQPGQAFDLAVALDAVLSDPTSASLRARAGLERAARSLSWQNVALAHIDVYSGATNG